MQLRTLSTMRGSAVTGLAAALSAGAMVAITATTAHAAYSPRNGDLCQAAENIQLYANDFSTPSYLVRTNEYIRMDITGNTLVNWTQGHGEGHSSRNFRYRHGDDSTGQLRVKNCR